MPSKVVDLSARSAIIRDEPFHVHFWECTPKEYLDFLKDPRRALSKIRIKLPRTCRIETTIENHDWLSAHTGGLATADGTIICNVGGGNVARSVYRIVSYAHDHASIGKYKKALLHRADQEQASARRLAN